ncbi:Putative KRR1 interacting protein [Septoria linicola]|uniref:KRR1 interacting protein n=1 Tax=Septoria linicola TaxID=215465 RepID=A0A9Q9AMA3_9PEZI|nr:putative KRR1 interacting protein [Septoria linicola]USW47396.1 Putative KRR1 interacting protein [Septoria linicola]
MPRAMKKQKLDFSDSESDAGVKLSGADGFKINEAYAARFEHNKKREEKARLEEKYGAGNVAGNGTKRKFDEGGDDDDDDESSTDEEEDDDAELADENVDEEIADVIRAIRNKDPRIKDPNAKFFKDFDPEKAATATKKDGKPMTLHDYQRERLLAGDVGDEDEEPVQTYQQEQDEMRRDLVGQMHATVAQEAESDDDDDMLVRKKKSKHEDMPAADTKSKKKVKLTEQDINEADKDPENYLSNFMAARAWLPTDGARFQPLESDDSEDDQKADEYEHLYNLRHEDPTANEKLKSFSRDVGKYGVRRDEKTGRAKQREREREMKELAKRQRDEEKARLRKLKVEEAEDKVKRIKEAAGLHGKELNLEEWRNVIEGDFDDDKWEQEMKRRFGEDYYAEDDAISDEEEDGESGSKTRKPKKPKFDDDIDINDIIPDFDATNEPNVALSDDEDADDDGGAPLPPASDEEMLDAEESTGRKRKSKKDRLQEKSEAKRVARKERAKIEEMVDATIPLDHPTLTTAASHKTPVVGFRYRETSPTSFGLSARDILFADDNALNQYAGLKKMAAFRDQEKKQRDKKRYSKKQRLRQWRKETFGAPDEPTGGFERVLGTVGDQVSTGPNHVSLGADGGENGNVKEGPRKKKRKNKKAKVAA